MLHQKSNSVDLQPAAIKGIAADSGEKWLGGPRPQGGFVYAPRHSLVRQIRGGFAMANFTQGHWHKHSRFKVNFNIGSYGRKLFFCIFLKKYSFLGKIYKEEKKQIVLL